jgi:hypothetical protein
MFYSPPTMVDELSLAGVAPTEYREPGVRLLERKPPVAGVLADLG